MIVWLASYPKSGNTLLRSILATYLYSSDGRVKFDHLYKIKQFPAIEDFKKLKIDMSNEKEVFANFIEAQKIINEDKKVKFIKTHSSLSKINNCNFTDFKNSLGAIYIVRDPRNVVTSYAHHYSIGVDEAFIQMTDQELFLSKTEIHPEVFISSWRLNYLSWKKASIPVLIVKYEDLIKNTKEKLIEVLNFFQTLGMNKSLYDDKKLENVIKSTQFSNMQKLEKEIGFNESVIDKKTNKKKAFFNLGPSNNWKTTLDTKLTNKIEESFSKEMEELGYL